MANINKTIRFYQPNDPYYWEVDNLPLSDLLSNDIVLDDKISELKDILNGIGGDSDGGGATNSVSGSVALESISNLKPFTVTDTSEPFRYGKVFVREGKFVARMNLPATRENGSRMMRDDPIWWNNVNYQTQAPGLSTTQLDLDFVRKTNAAGRTAVCEFYKLPTGEFQHIDIPSFDSQDFNGDNPPQERLDLIYIKATKSLDTDGDSPTATDHVLGWGAQNTSYAQEQIPGCKLGIVKGAYFRTDGIHSNGKRFPDDIETLTGRIMGSSQADIPANTNLPGFGSVPMPDDLVNQSNSHLTANAENWALLQIQEETSFCIPVAYVRVPMGYQAGDPLNSSNVVDIRPFLRTTELTYNERAGIVMADSPGGDNPFVTTTTLNSSMGTFDDRITTNTSNLNLLSGTVDTNSTRIAVIDPKVLQHGYDLDGPLSLGADLISRVGNLEAGGAGGGGGGNLGVVVPQFSMARDWHTIALAGAASNFNGATAQLGSHIDVNHNPSIIYGNFKLIVGSASNSAPVITVNINGSAFEVTCPGAATVNPQQYRFQAPIDYNSNTGGVTITFGVCSGVNICNLFLESYHYGVLI